MGSNGDEPTIRQAPLPLLAQVPDKVERVKLIIPTAGGGVIKREHPMSDGSSIEHHLFCLKEFEEMALQLAFDGDDHFSCYRQTLQEPLRTQWDGQIAGVARTIANWQVQIQTLLTSFIPPDAYEKYEDYLAVVKKPRKMTPTQLANRLRVLNLYSVRLPSTAGVPQLMPERKLCTHFFRMMPPQFKSAYKSSGQTLTGATLLALATYFDTLAMMESSGGAKRHGGSNNDGGSHKKQRHNNNNNNNKYNKNKGGGGNRNNSDNNNNNKGGGKCRVHPNGQHEWKDCARNPKSHNYNNPKFLPRAERNNNTSGSSHFSQGPSDGSTVRSSDGPQLFYANGQPAQSNASAGSNSTLSTKHNNGTQAAATAAVQTFQVGTAEEPNGAHGYGFQPSTHS